jgi:hypothetical protein
LLFDVGAVKQTDLFTPSLNSISGWSNGNPYQYPGDFNGILNQVKIYKCETSGKRVIISNGIPDHAVTQGNPNSPCQKNWAIEVSIVAY